MTLSFSVPKVMALMTGVSMMKTGGGSMPKTSAVFRRRASTSGNCLGETLTAAPRKPERLNSSQNSSHLAINAPAPGMDFKAARASRSPLNS